MQALILLQADGRARLAAPGPERAARLPAHPHNAGRGDARKGIVPVIKPLGPSLETWEGGAYLAPADLAAGPAPAGAALLVQPTDDLGAVASAAAGLHHIAIDFHRIGDGRGYSSAVLLRTRFGFSGQLRAVGAVTIDQLFALARCGFDAFALRADQDAQAALTAFASFTLPYQAQGQSPSLLNDRAGAVAAAAAILARRAGGRAANDRASAAA